MKCYLSGPMTGLPLLNFPAFHAEAVHMRASGHEVVNPAELNPDPTATWESCMFRDLEALSTCDAIVMLPGWCNSYGAQIERLWAKRLGLTVMGAVA